MRKKHKIQFILNIFLISSFLLVFILIFVLEILEIFLLAFLVIET